MKSTRVCDILIPPITRSFKEFPSISSNHQLSPESIRTTEREAHVKYTKEFLAKATVGQSPTVRQTKSDMEKLGIFRFYVKIFFENKSTMGQLDSGADFSVLSANVADVLCEDWKSKKSAGKIQITGVTGGAMTVIDCKFLQIGFSPDALFSHPFVIVKEPEILLLSSHLIYDQHLGITWDKQKENPFLTWDKANGKQMKIPLYSQPFQVTAKLAEKVVLGPGEKKVVTFDLGQDNPTFSSKTAIVSNIANQLSNETCQEILVCPSFSDVDGKICKAVVKNFSSDQKILEVSSLSCTVEQGDSCSVLDSLSNDSSTDLDSLIENAFQGGNMPLLAQTIEGLSPKILDSLNKTSAEIDSLTSDLVADSEPFQTHDSRCADIKMARSGLATVGTGTHEFRVSDAGYEPSEKEKESMLDKIYDKAEDKADFNLTPGTDVGIDFGPEKSVWEQYDPSQTPEAYAPFVERLIQQHESLFSRSDLDCGDISISLGTFSLPLQRKLPNQSHKIYYLQGRKAQSLKIILTLMLRHNLIKRVKSASFSSPVFLIDKRDTTALPRLLADVRILNEHLVKVQQIIPKIQSIIESVGDYKPVLFSNLDLASAFFSLRPDEKTQKLLTLSTQYGLYSANIGVQGLSHIPTLFSDYIYRALHTDLDGMPDPITFTIHYLDDVLVFSPESSLGLDNHHSLLNALKKNTNPEFEKLTPAELATACDHYNICDLVMSRLRHHNFKVRVNKFKMFRDRSKTLGVVMSKEGIQVDPDRTSKILATPFPTNRKGMQSFCGFLSSLCLYSSNQLSHFHGILAELTSATKDFKVQEKHRTAFERAKALLAKEPLFLNYPNQSNAKLLFVDSSDILLGAVLFDVIFPPLELEEIECPYDIEVMASYTSVIQVKLNELQFPGFPIPIQSKENSSFFEALIYWIETLKIENVPTLQKLLRQFIITQLLDNSTIKHHFANSLPTGVTWANFVAKYANSNSGIDSQNILVSLSAQLLERHIGLIDSSGIKIFSGGTKAAEKPRIWLFLEQNSKGTKFIPIYKYKKTKEHPFTSNMKVNWDIQFMNKSNVFQALQNYVNSPSKSHFSAKVLGYMSKCIPSQDREKSIWLKEANALVSGLAKFKPLIEVSPAVLCVVDSQVVYFLSHKNLLNTNLKAKRLGTLLHLEYPNILVHAIKGSENVSDKLSRLFSLPKAIKDSIALSELRIPAEIPEIENQAFTIEEARKKVSELGNRHSIVQKASLLHQQQQQKQKQQKEGKSKQHETEHTPDLLPTPPQAEKLEKMACSKKRGEHKSCDILNSEAKIMAISLEDTELSSSEYPGLTQVEKTLLQNIRPLAVLTSRLSKEQFLLEQEKLPLYQELIANESSGGEYMLKAGLIVNSKDQKIFVPKSLEGILLSHSHLLLGHAGWNKLYIYVREKYSFPNLKEKCYNFSTLCQVCIVSNPSTLRKSAMHTVVSSFPMEVVTADLLEVEAVVGKKNHKILVICDYFTKVIFTYDLTSFTSKAFISKFKEFLSTTGLVTKVLVVDNASFFGNRDVLSFLHMTGIKKVRGNANHSQSRGLVESTIRILQTLIRKLLSLSDRYDYESILFLAPVLLNRSVNVTTGYSPYEMLFGRDLSKVGPLSSNLDPPTYKIFTEQVKDEVQKLRQLIEARIEEVAEKVKQQKAKFLEKENAKRLTKPALKLGTVVFLKDFSVPKSGRARKFRPRFLKSPNIVMASSATSVVTMRLADGYVSRHHPDDMLEFKAFKKDPELYENLPPSVTAFLGKPISAKSLAELASKDQLEMIYKDNVTPAAPSGMTTRRQAKKAKEMADALQLSTSDEIFEDEEQDLENEPSLLVPFKTVSFAPTLSG